MFFRRNRLALAEILCLAVSAVVHADFDGRLPVSTAEPLDPLGPLPPRARSFMEKRAGDFIVYWDSLLETPRYLSPRGPALVASRANEYEEGPALDQYFLSSAREFIDENAEFFGVDSARLDGPRIYQLGRHWLLLFQQTAHGLPIRGANVRLLLDRSGHLDAMKAYLLRPQARNAPPDTDPTELVAELKSRGYELLDIERQWIFPRPDHTESRPVWRFLVATSEGEPAEILAGLQASTLGEERRFVFELLQGDVRANYPNPDDSQPGFFFSTPEDLGDYPVEDVLVTTLTDATYTDTEGYFNVFANGQTTILNWALAAGACRSPVQLEIGGESVVACPPVDFDLDTTLDIKLRMMSAFVCAADNGIVRDTFAVAHDVALWPTIRLNPRGFGNDPSLLMSARLMAYRHLLRFMRQSDARIADLEIPTLEVGPLDIFVLGEGTNTRHYLPLASAPRICLSYRLRDPLNHDDIAPAQWLTPTHLNHEYAHHVIFRITGFRESSKFDCFDEVFSCVQFSDDVHARSELSFVEGLTDALAAFYSGIPKFGYYAEGQIPGPLAYDISSPDGRLRDETRETVSLMLWSLREEAIATGFDERRETDAVEQLLYYWLGFNKCFSDTDRSFEFGPCLVDELLDIDRAFNGRRYAGVIGSVVRRFPDLVRATFIRGDANQDGDVGLSDVVYILAHLYRGEVDELCLDAMDVDDRGDVNLTDPIFLLNHLFLGGPTPAAPFADCGWDLTEDVFVCDRFFFCSRP